MGIKTIENTLVNTDKCMILLKQSRELWGKVNNTLETVRLLTRGDRDAVSAASDCIYSHIGNPLAISLATEELKKTAESAGMENTARQIAAVALKKTFRTNRANATNIKKEIHDYLSKTDSPVIFTYMLRVSNPELFLSINEDVKKIFDRISRKKAEAIKNCADSLKSQESK